MKTEKPKKLIRWYILGAIGAVLMAAGDWLLGCIPLQQTDTGLSTEATICPAPMGCGGLCLPLAGSNRGLTLLLCGKSTERGHRRKIQKNQKRPVSVREFTVAVALTIHTWVATMAWFTTYLGPRIGEEAAIAAVTAYQDGMLLAIAPMYVPMILAFGIHFVMLLAGKTRYSRWMLAFHPVTWNLLLVTVPDIAQAMQVPVVTWMSVMSQSSTNTAIVIWCIAAAVYERSHTQ